MTRLLFFFLIFSFFSACNLKPKYTRPEMEIGDSYRFDSLEGEKYANLAWWKQFEDEDLNSLIEIALKNNQDLKVATARVAEFYARYRIAFSQLFPELDATANFDRIQLSEDVNFQPPIPGVPRINNLYAFLFKLSYEVDFWGKIRNATDAAKSIYLSQVYSRQNVVLTLVSSVAASYILIKQYIHQLTISKLTYESRCKSWEIALLRFKGGLVSELEVKQAESEALVAKVQMKNFEILIGKQEDLLSVLLGKAPGPICEGKELVELALPKKIPSGLPSDLLENRPDILQAEERIRAANAEVGVARAAFFPSISLTGILGQRTTSIRDFFDSSATLWDMGMAAFEPLFTGWRITNQLKESEAVLLQAIHSYQQTILTALREVDDALLEHQKSLEKLQIQTERVASLKEYLKLANLRYFNGQNDYLTVLDAEKSLFAAELVKAETMGDLYLSLVNLYKALGQGWDVEKDLPPGELSYTCEEESYAEEKDPLCLPPSLLEEPQEEEISESPVIVKLS